MARTSPPVLLLMVIMVALEGSFQAQGATRRSSRETNMVMYMQDVETGKNQSAYVIAGLKGKASTALDFGSVLVVDDALTEGIDNTSKHVGRAQGLYATSALDGSVIRYMFSLVFKAGPYDGSTLEIQGVEPFLLKKREVAVVSGTGLFRYARGYVTVETAKADRATLNAVIKLTVNVRHPMMSI